MLNCDYTNNTAYTFDKQLCGTCENINYSGVATESELKKALACRLTNDQWIQLFVPKILDIPTQKPSIEGVVSVNSCLDIISKRLIKTPTVTGYTNAAGVFVPGNEISNAECTNLTGRKLIIEAVITQKIIYTSLVPDQMLHSATFKIPFSTFIIVDGTTPLTQEFSVYPYIEDVFVCMLSERTVFSNNTIFIKATSIC